MRPRVFPAEDPLMPASPSALPSRFNEAAGIPRGRHVQAAIGERMTAASMRPRVFPAEDTGGGGILPYRRAGFNEAAGIPRGRRPRSQLRLGRLLEASMRPRVFPAEDAGEDPDVTVRQALQ